MRTSKRPLSRYFYPRPPRGGRRSCQFMDCQRGPISIHALREEGDGTEEDKQQDGEEFLSTPSARRATGEKGLFSSLRFYFYPRPPRGGRRETPSGSTLFSIRFLSTPSARRATCRKDRGCLEVRDFYPRPPRGGRRADCVSLAAIIQISIHALREEGDDPLPTGQGVCCYFYPRPPRGGRRHRFKHTAQSRMISIHALREEGDVSPSTR